MNKAKTIGSAIAVILLVLVIIASLFAGVMGYFKSRTNAQNIAAVYDQSVINLCNTIKQMVPDRYVAQQGGCSISEVVKK